MYNENQCWNQKIITNRYVFATMAAVVFTNDILIRWCFAPFNIVKTL